MRWKCGTHIQCCQPYNATNCVTMEVVDSGPACWVEDDANMNIIDATPLACQHFFNHHHVVGLINVKLFVIL